MITGNINDTERYFGVNENLKKVFEYLKTLGESAESGSFEIDGINGSVAQPKLSDVPSKEEIKAEAHRKYMDIHYVIEGMEAIGYANVNSLKPITEYNSDDDYLLLSGEVNKVVLNKGDFCIVFPEDAHVPCMEINNSLKKAIVKILD